MAFSSDIQVAWRIFSSMSHSTTTDDDDAREVCVLCLSGTTTNSGAKHTKQRNKIYIEKS